MRQRYWFCIIGPTDQDEIPSGADSPLRSAVRAAFEKTMGKEDESCWSGWGVTEADKDLMLDSSRASRTGKGEMGKPKSVAVQSPYEGLVLQALERIIERMEEKR